MASTLAHGFSRVGNAFIVLSPILGWIGVALSGSNTSANALFGGFQYSIGGLLKMPPLLLPSLNSVGAEIGKPIAPQTASVGVSPRCLACHLTPPGEIAAGPGRGGPGMTRARVRQR